MNAIAKHCAFPNPVEPIPTENVQRAMLTGDRLHLQHGPINLVIKADGSNAAVRRAYDCAEQRMSGLLRGLADKLYLLRSPNVAESVQVADETAQRMISSVSHFRGQFVTPMAAVAGAVADTILAAMKRIPGLQKIYVNNGGDIALYLAPGLHMQIGMVPTLAAVTPDSSLCITGGDGVGGIATSGWDGHSLSLGIADAVTVIAKNAAVADVAATLIANRVDCDDDNIARRRALDIDPDTELGQRLVTVCVGQLSDSAINEALDRGEQYAWSLVERGIIHGTIFSLQGQKRTVGLPCKPPQRLGS